MPLLIGSMNGEAAQVKRLYELLSRVRPIPEEWKATKQEREEHKDSESMEVAECSNYSALVNAWRKALKWTDGLDCTLSVMLASSASTMLIGEQLWIMVLSPPGCAKTTLLEGLAINKRWIYSKDSIRGFYQGWRSEDGADLSVASLARGKTLATKDGDTLLKAPNLHQILSEARGLYDRVGRTHYRNAVMHDYEGHRMTWLLCGTFSLRDIDESELGCRFLSCVIMDSIEDEFEDDVAWRAVNQEIRSMRVESNGSTTTQHPEELTRAMQLTGGYVDYLRRNVVDLLPGIEMSDEAMRECTRLGKFTSYMRARPHSIREDAEATREFSARLAKQFSRLAYTLAAVLNRDTVDREVMRRVRKVALDTSRGPGLAIATLLRDNQDRGIETRALEAYLTIPYVKLARLLRFMRSIGMVESFTPEGLRRRVRYRLTPYVENLYDAVMR